MNAILNLVFVALLANAAAVCAEPAIPDFVPDFVQSMGVIPESVVPDAAALESVGVPAGVASAVESRISLVGSYVSVPTPTSTPSFTWTVGTPVFVFPSSSDSVRASVASSHSSNVSHSSSSSKPAVTSSRVSVSSHSSNISHSSSSSKPAVTSSRANVSSHVQAASSRAAAATSRANVSSHIQAASSRAAAATSRAGDIVSRLSSASASVAPVPVSSSSGSLAIETGAGSFVAPTIAGVIGAVAGLLLL